MGAPFLVRHWINLTTTDAGTATTMIRILGINAAVSLPKVLYGSLFRGIQRMELNNIIDVAASAIQQLGIIVLLLLGAKTIGASSWIAASAVLGTIGYAFAAGRLFGWRSLVPGYAAGVVGRNLHFTGHMTAISILALVHTQADKVIVSKFLPVADLGLYGFASTTVARATFVIGAVSQAAFPALTGLFRRNDRAGLMSEYNKLQDLISFGALPLFAGIVFAARPAYSFLFSPAIAERLLLPTALLCLGYLMNSLLTMPYMVSLAVGRPQIASRLNLLAIFVVLPTTLVLILWLGLVGGGLSWVFYNVFAYAYMVPRVCRECLEISPLGWYVHFLRVLVLGGLTYGVGWAVLTILGSFSIGSLAVAYVIASMAFLVIAYLWIGPELKMTVRRLPASLMPGRTGSL